jgi:ATP synthase protein I
VPLALTGKWESQLAKQPEQRSALALGVEWASKVTTVALGFSVPPLLGFGLDRWWGSTPVATLIGIVLGFVSGLLQTVRLAKDLPGGSPRASGRTASRWGAEGQSDPGPPDHDSP